eukprot:25146-Pelagococcus_subviridis.AAC.1
MERRSGTRFCRGGTGGWRACRSSSGRRSRAGRSAGRTSRGSCEPPAWTWIRHWGRPTRKRRDETPS